MYKIFDPVNVVEFSETPEDSYGIVTARGFWVEMADGIPVYMDLDTFDEFFEGEGLRDCA